MSAPWPHRLTGAALEEAKRLRTRGLTINEISRRLEITNQTVSASLRDAGFPMRVKRPPDAPKMPQGIRAPELARDFGDLPDGHPLAELDAEVLRERAWLQHRDRRRAQARRELGYNWR